MPHALVPNQIYNSGGGGTTFNEIYAFSGDDIDIDPNRNFMLGKITLRTNSRHNLKHGDKIWFALAGDNSSGPIINCFQGPVGNRNFGPARNMGRSNMRNIGYMNRYTYGRYNSTRADEWDKTGPRVNQVWLRRVNMYFVGRCDDDREVVKTINYPLTCHVIMDWT